MNRVLDLVSTNWHFARWLRLGFGVYFVAQAIAMADLLSGALGGLFLFQAITNTGCCGSGGCAVPASNTKENLPAGETVYEEVKGK